jgi:D-alanyl-D-alanine carboxypeptidase (penicillin-binding protein 5/6)
MKQWGLLLIAFFSLGRALADGVAAPPADAPAIDAKAYYLVDATSGALLAESSSAQPLEPASLTKLMTAYLVFSAIAEQELDMSDMVLVSEKAWRATGSRTFIEVDTEVSVSDLLHGLIIQSGNDAAIALAEHLAGTEAAFAEQMNETAVELGMTGSHFRNVTGLPSSGHVSTAADLAVLAQALIEEFPQYYDFYSQREFTYNGIKQHNRNALLWRDDSVDGLKTGYTRAAGYCLVSSAERDGRRLIAVVLGSSTPDQRMAGSQALLDYGFDAFETHRLFTGGEAIAEARVFKGSLEATLLGVTEDVYVTVPAGQYSELSASMVMHKQMIAPIGLHAPVGEIELALNGRTLSVLPLVALEAVDQGWLLSRVADGISLMLE